MDDAAVPRAARHGGPGAAVLCGLVGQALPEGGVPACGVGCGLLLLRPGRAADRVWHTTEEYLSFIALVGSLFVVSGGIHINVKREATPLANVVFLLIGAVTANLLGTTGASMLLIRPWLRMNKYRVTGHHVVFFIFIVSNVGGCLTPIGDPPLFLGYLMGVPFGWVARHCLGAWAMGVGLLLVMFVIVDYRNYLRAPRAVREELAGHEQWRLDGLTNLVFLGVILAAVFVNHPPFLRELLMAGAAAGSYFTTPKPVHESNHFTLHPIKEVAILFVGIFGTMMPALDWLQGNAGTLASATPGLFYWGAGSLSSVLDNAPTYLCFLKAAFGRFVKPEVVAQVAQASVQAHGSVAAVTGPYAGEAYGRPSPRSSSTYRRRYGAGTGEFGRDPIGLSAGEYQVPCLYRGGERGGGVFRGQYLHWKRPELHGESHCRPSEGCPYADLSALCRLRYYAAIHAADAGGCVVGVFPVVGSDLTTRERCSCEAPSCVEWGSEGTSGGVTTATRVCFGTDQDLHGTMDPVTTSEVGNARVLVIEGEAAIRRQLRAAALARNAYRVVGRRRRGTRGSARLCGCGPTQSCSTWSFPTWKGSQCSIKIERVD